MNTIDLGYVIPGAYSGLSWIRGGTAVSAVPTKLRLVHLR